MEFRVYKIIQVNENPDGGIVELHKRCNSKRHLEIVWTVHSNNDGTVKHYDFVEQRNLRNCDNSCREEQGVILLGFGI
jgi:hypothetical protein